MKLKLVSPNRGNMIASPIAEELANQYFNVEILDTDCTYDRKSTVFVVSAYQYNENKSTIDKFINDGYYVLIENLQEANCPLQFSQPNVLYTYTAIKNDRPKNAIEVPMHFWYFESQAWSGKPAQTGFSVDYRYLPRIYTVATKKFFMPMNRVRWFRDIVHTTFRDILDDSIFSYYDAGIPLPDDLNNNEFYWDRYVNIDWYNQTRFTVVVETQVEMGAGSLFVTEKSLKPLVFKHPFISISCPGTVALLKKSGFETFDNLFNESYDNYVIGQSASQKIKNIYTQVKNYSHKQYDSLTIEKIEHNYNWFFNKEEVKKRYKHDLLVPLLEKLGY